MTGGFAALLLAAASADATIVTFDSPTSGPVFHEYVPATPYRDSGLKFTSSYSRYVWLPGAGQGAANGTQVFETGYSVLTVAANDGLAFTFRSVEYGQGIYHDPTSPLTITLFLAAGGIASYDLTSTESFQLFAPGSVDVTALTFSNTGGFLALDNFDVSGVPESASWAMMLAGFGMAGTALRTRRRVTLSAF